MEKKYIKKFAMILTVLIVLVAFGSFTLGTEHSTNENTDINGDMINFDPVDVEENQNTEDTNNTILDIENSDAPNSSKDIIGSVSEDDRIKAEFIDKYNDKLSGNVAYGLYIAQRYSLPICFIGITMGAFNFLILGNKKLDKKEQGFGWIVFFTMALVAFNVLPLVFAVLAAGR